MNLIMPKFDKWILYRDPVCLSCKNSLISSCLHHSVCQTLSFCSQAERETGQWRETGLESVERERQARRDRPARSGDYRSVQQQHPDRDITE